MKDRIAIIGGGAAGFFAAIACTMKNPKAEVIILEKSDKLLSKVKVSGGGRCNVTNANPVSSFHKNYARGFNFLKKAFSIFSSDDTIQWFETRSVKLKTEPDGRIFPASNMSQSIIDCLIGEARVNGVKIYTGFDVTEITKKEDDFILSFKNKGTLAFNKTIITTGGFPKMSSYSWLLDLGLTIIPPVPSLFTFNIPEFKLNGLQGISLNIVNIKICGTKFTETGPLLITHWGFSGPSILRLSAWAARELHQQNYNFHISINFLPDYTEDTLRTYLLAYKTEHPKKSLSQPLFNLPRRLWDRLISLCDIDEEIRWGELPNKSINKLIEELLRSKYHVKGKTTFKEEFVTCGGISLNDIDSKTMESKNCPGLYFAGEILDIDGITGGFNFQAAWTTGYIAGSAAAGCKEA